MPRIDETRILKLFNKMYNKAEEIIKDPSRFKTMLKDAGDMIEGTREGPLKDIASEVRLLINMLRDYRSGEYTRLPRRTLLSVTAALIYLISPVDFIPDFIPLVGVVDDIFVLNFVWKQVRKDLEDYAFWRTGVSVSEGRVVLPDELVTKPHIVDADYDDTP